MSASADQTNPTDTPKPSPTFITNLPVTSIPAALAFYTALNFTPLPAWSDASTASFLLPAPNQFIALMLHDHTRFKTFMRPAASVVDAHSSTETIYSIMCQTREEVDTWLSKAEGAGGKKDPYVMEGFGAGMGMYVRSWADLDGHVWEACAMLAGGCAGAQGAGEKGEGKVDEKGDKKGEKAE